MQVISIPDMRIEGSHVTFANVDGEQVKVAVCGLCSALVAVNDDGELRHLISHVDSTTDSGTPVGASNGPSPDPSNAVPAPAPPVHPLADVAALTLAQLLPTVTEATATHRTDCTWCTPATQRRCPLLGLAVAALDLTICCWRITKVAQTGERGVS